MASTTTNLGLLKKDPSTDGADTFNIRTMLNDNWDKIDAAVSAARAAGDYEETKAYAAGDYCTHDGKLYRCATAIPAGEAWNAAHWAETSLGAEMKAVYAGLTAHTGSRSNPHGVTAAQVGAAKTVTLSCTVPVSWTASGSFYYQQVGVAGMLAADNPIADILPGGDNAANKLYAEAWGKVQSIDTLAGAVRIWCTAAPAVAFPVQFKVVR